MSEREKLCIRITDYLETGGLFNPGQMEHDKVRDLLIDCRDALATPAAPGEQENEPQQESLQDYLQRGRALKAAAPPSPTVQAGEWIFPPTTVQEPVRCPTCNGYLRPLCRDAWHETAPIAAQPEGARQEREVHEFLHSPEAEKGFRRAMETPAEVWYPCGAKASEGAPLRDCPIHGKECFKGQP
jgi:hypothetical protein